MAKRRGWIWFLFVAVISSSACRRHEAAQSPASEPPEPAESTVKPADQPAEGSAGKDDQAPTAPAEPLHREARADFDGGGLPAGWTAIHQHDFREKEVVVREGALVLRADTLDTDERTVKSLALRLDRPVDFAAGVRISVDLSWTEEPNASYLAAGIFLSPHKVDDDPEDARDYLAFEYKGVPPRNLARPSITARSRGRLMPVEWFGWPKVREGRAVGTQGLVLTVRGSSLVVEEGGREIYRGSDTGLSLESGWVYLRMSSHSHYRSRQVRFDNFEMRAL
jgi:hypothetical protein